MTARLSISISYALQKAGGSIAFSHGEKVPEGRMRGLRPEVVAPSAPHPNRQSPHPALKRATFSQGEKEVGCGAVRGQDNPANIQYTRPDARP